MSNPRSELRGRAVWAILARIDRRTEADYLSWFHGVHIPEKLARPGYTWAAHYRMLEPAPAAEGHAGDLYLALFGGETTRTFLDPSPAQLKPRQDETTRRMMASRAGSRMLILAEEWREVASAGEEGPPRCLELTLTGLLGADEDYGAWLIQEELAVLRAADGFRSVRKLAATSGSPRHAVMVGFEIDATVLALRRARGETAWSRRWSACRTRACVGPLVGNRVWPPPRG